MKFEELIGALDAPDTTFESKAVWGSTLHFASLSAAEIFEYYESCDAAKGTPERRLNGAKLVARSLVEEAESTVRVARDQADIMLIVEKMLTKNPKTLGDLVMFVLKLNGLDEEAAKKEAKNVSAGAQSGDSPSASR